MYNHYMNTEEGSFEFIENFKNIKLMKVFLLFTSFFHQREEQKFIFIIMLQI